MSFPWNRKPQWFIFTVIFRFKFRYCSRALLLSKNCHWIVRYSLFLDVFHQCTGEAWPLINKGESHAIRYLEQIDGVLSIVSEKNELLWYVRGKTLNSENRGQIYRANNPAKSSSYDLSTNPHGNIPNTCIQHDNNSNSNNNYFRGGERSNKTKVDRNNNGYNDVNGNYEPQNGMQLVEIRFFLFWYLASVVKLFCQLICFPLFKFYCWFFCSCFLIHRQKFYRNDRVRANGHNFGSPINNDVCGSPGGGRRTSTGLYNYDLVGDDFFMELAKIDLGCNFINRKTQCWRGKCKRMKIIVDFLFVREANP